jgi:O-antigen ligase
MNFGHFVGFILVILAAINYYKDKLGNIYNLIALTLGFSLAVSVVVSLLLPKIGIHAITGRWQGVAGNPNTLGIVCIISVWANVADYFSRKGEIRIWLKLVLLIITFIALIGARSTTAFGVSLFAFFGTWYLIRLENRPLLTKLIINAIMGWLGVVLIMSVYFLKPELLSIEGGLTMVGKDSTLTGRTALWELASNAIALKPWLGWGFDSNMTVLQHFDLFYGQFHNGYLDLLVRGGYVSLVVFVLLVMQTLIRLRALAKFEYRQAIIWFVILVCIILHNVTEASIMRETHLFWYLFVLIIYAIPSYKNVGMSLK